LASTYTWKLTQKYSMKMTIAEFNARRGIGTTELKKARSYVNQNETTSSSNPSWSEKEKEIIISQFLTHRKTAKQIQQEFLPDRTEVAIRSQGRYLRIKYNYKTEGTPQSWGAVRTQQPIYA
jgi:DNA-directed RNA polymerase specialized sigma subunit